MSAYVNGKNRPVLSITEKPDNLPHLPQIDHELENYFAAARQLETTVARERSLVEKYSTELHSLHAKYVELGQQLENKTKECQGLEEQKKSLQNLVQKMEEQLKTVESLRAREKQSNQKLQDQINSLRSQYSHLHKEANLRLQEYASYVKRLKSQLSTHRVHENASQQELETLRGQIDRLRDEKKKDDFELTLLRANLESVKQREESLKNKLQSLDFDERSMMEEKRKLSRELEETRSLLNRYQASWNQVSQVEQKARKLMAEAAENKKKVEELSEICHSERKRREDLEELIQKEKREKQIALTCLHTAGAKLAQANRALDAFEEKSKKEYEPKRGIELDFQP